MRRAFPDLGSEQIALVEEENDGGVSEPLVVADGVEQLQRLLHPVLWEMHKQCTSATNQLNII